MTQDHDPSEVSLQAKLGLPHLDFFPDKVDLYLFQPLLFGFSVTVMDPHLATVQPEYAEEQFL